MDDTALNQLQATYPGCSLALLADIDVAIPLRTATGQVGIGQEKLNALCMQAKSIFGAVPGSGADVAVQLTHEGQLVLVRDAIDAAIAFVAMCDASVGLEDFVRDVRTGMAQSA